MSIELKPCPFCGTDAKMMDVMGMWQSGGYGPDGVRVRCQNTNCGGRTLAFYGPTQSEDAVDAWNTRLTPPTDLPRSASVQSSEEQAA